MFFFSLLGKLLSRYDRKIIRNSEMHLPWATCFSAVDIAIVDIERDIILLGRKKDRWCIPGGFTDPSSNCDEEDAVRELFEETRIEAHVEDLTYIGNVNIPDDRYKNGPHAIRTHFFFLPVDSTAIKTNYAVTDRLRPLDDLDEIKWFPLSERFHLIHNDKLIQPPHRILIGKLKEFMHA